MANRPTSFPPRALAVVLVVATAVVLAVVPARFVVVRAQAGSAPDPDLVAAQAALTRLSLPDRVGQLVATSVPGTRLDPVARRRLRSLHPGGVILFAENHRSSAQLRELTRTVQELAPGTIVSIDQEGGVVKRLAGLPPWRSAPALGASASTGATRTQGRLTGAALDALGVQLDLAPVADLDLPPARVMRERSFGRAPARVSRHVAAFVRGLHDGSGAAAVKHFPGFGGASVNSDDALARIDRPRAKLLAEDLAPFRAAVGAGTDVVMLSHGVYVGIDRRNPASASPAAYRLLRRDLAFDGVAMTDALHAAGFRAATRTSVAEGCVRVVRAGADVALLTGSLSDALACRAQLLRAVRSGMIPRERVDEAAIRVLRLRSRLGLLGAQPAGVGGSIG